jgi:hypothetical protein
MALDRTLEVRDLRPHAVAPDVSRPRVSDEASAEVVTPTKSGLSNYVGWDDHRFDLAMNSILNGWVRAVKTPRGVVH